MFVLKRDYGSGFFNIQEIAPSDVADFIECGVAIFGSETHASYAQSLLGAVSAPHWKPNHQQHGRVLTDEHPFFVPANGDAFTREWLRLMCSEVRLHLAQHHLPAKEAVFDIPTDVPAPAPWAILVSRSNNQIYVVDRLGNVVGAKTKDELVRMKQTTFELEAATAVRHHLAVIDIE